MANSAPLVWIRPLSVQGARAWLTWLPESVPSRRSGEFTIGCESSMHAWEISACRFIFVVEPRRPTHHDRCTAWYENGVLLAVLVDYCFGLTEQIQ